MKHQYLINTPLDTAVLEYIKEIQNTGTTHGTETISVCESCGRVTANAVYAKICSPHYTACAMDGIALKSSLTFGAAQTSPVQLSSCDYTEVDTGDPLPYGADCVVMVEDLVESSGKILLHDSAVPWQNVRQIGEDICAGDMILPSYSEITPAAVGAMLAGGVLNILAVKRPVVGIIPTGDEIIPPCDNPKDGDIIEFNSSIFKGILETWGASALVYPIVKDDRDLIVSALKSAVSECDAVILNAGSSAGREDFSAYAIENIGKIIYHGIAIKPGKPAVLGICGNVPVLGVPGYPVSGIIVLEHILKPVIQRLCMKTLPKSETVNARIGRQLTSSLKYREFVRARVSADHHGNFTAVPLSRGAGVITSFVKADGIIDIPQNSEGFNAGDFAQVSILKPRESIMNTISVAGSHDPLIDEIADIIKQRWQSIEVASSHVGSMGGIMAVKRSEAQMGGIHLLDSNTGQYNLPYLEKYFPNGGVVLIEGVKRIQGIMVKRGNPLGIRGFTDLSARGISFVNRQKGSGTRILFDYLCEENHMDSEKIYGYQREEYTHTGVAAQIAAGTADAGLGIFSSAKIYGLDFIPVGHEEYDILADKESLSYDKVKKFIEVLHSGQLKRRLCELGGYEVTNPGTIKKEL